MSECRNSHHKDQMVSRRSKFYENRPYNAKQGLVCNKTNSCLRKHMRIHIFKILDVNACHNREDFELWNDPSKTSILDFCAKILDGEKIFVKYFTGHTVFGKTWYVSSQGQSRLACHSVLGESPCASLYDVINMTSEADVIKYHGGDIELELCMETPIRHSLLIEGTEGSSIGCSRDGGAVLYMAGDGNEISAPTWNLTGITVSRGNTILILCQNLFLWGLCAFKKYYIWLWIIMRRCLNSIFNVNRTSNSGKVETCKPNDSCRHDIWNTVAYDSTVSFFLLYEYQHGNKCPLLWLVKICVFKPRALIGQKHAPYEAPMGLRLLVKCVYIDALQWRHNGRDGVSNHPSHYCLLNRYIWRRSKKSSKLRVTGLCAGNSPVTGQFPAHMASNAENVSTHWRHHGKLSSTQHCLFYVYCYLSGVVRVCNGELTMDNVNFLDATLVAACAPYFVYSAGIQMYKDGEIVSTNCSHVRIFITNSIFDVVSLAPDLNVIYTLEQLLQLNTNIIVNCDNAVFRSTYVNYNNRLVNIGVHNNSDVHFKASKWIGLADDFKMAGLDVALNSGTMIFDQCYMVDVGPRDSMIAAHFGLERVAPISIRQAGLGDALTVFIINSTFENNTGLLSVTAEKSYVVVENCTFRANHVMKDGATILINASPASSLVIDQCIFLDNTAGILNGDFFTVSPVPPIIVSYEEHRFFIPWYKVEERKLHVMSCKIGTDSKLNKTCGVCVEKTIAFGGRGGAVYLRDGLLYLNNSLFISNKASFGGGAIFHSTHSSIYSLVTNCYFSPHEHEGENTELSLVYLSGAYFIGNCVFSGGIYTGALLYVSETMVMLSTVNFTCAQGLSLVAVNASESVLTPTEYSQFPIFIFALYYCVKCEDGYTLDSAYMHIGKVGRITEIESRTFSVEYIPGECLPCPDKALCNLEVYSARGDWGMIYNHSIWMYTCPSGYCMSEGNLKMYNACTSNRDGILCSRCMAGYSEDLFSDTCVPNEQCDDYWFFIVIFVVVFAYAAFLLHQIDVQKLILNWKAIKCFDKPCKRQDSDIRHNTLGHSVIILFCYFQDALLIRSYLPASLIEMDYWKKIMVSFMGGLFRFQIDCFSLAGNICFMENLTFTRKTVLKLSFIPLLLATLMLPMLLRDKHNYIKSRITTALFLAILFSYQKLLVTCFQLLQCVEIAGMSVLFYQADVECYQVWQTVIFVMSGLSLFPFCLHMSTAPALLSNGLISTKEFFFSIPLSPLFMLSWVVRFNPWMIKTWRKSYVSSNETVFDPSTKQLVQMLCKCYRPMKYRTWFSWNGVLLSRRTLLVIGYIFHDSPLIKNIHVFFVCFSFLMIQLSFRPYKNNSLNASASTSDALLCVLAFVSCVASLLAETDESSAAVLTVITMFRYITEALFLWLPMAGLSVVLSVLLYRVGEYFVVPMTARSICRSKVKNDT